MTTSAPAFSIRLSDGHDLTPQSFSGEPFVLAFFESPGLPGDLAPEELDRARAELRGLGAALVAIARRGLWCFRPDDDAQSLAGAEDEEQLGALRERFGVPAGAAGVFVIDGGSSLELATILEGEGTTFAVVVDALEAAGRELASRRRRHWRLSRRQLLVGSLVAAFTSPLVDGCRARPPVSPGSLSDDEVDVTLTVNGAARTLRIDARVTLLDALRERLGLWGTKKGCDQGQCGACTVLVGGRRVNACLTLALAAEGQPVVTIEGLAHGDLLHPLQRAFIVEDGFQCGYCTPGQIMSACGLLAEHGGRGELRADDIRSGMSGNLCRCGAYPNIVAAIRRASRES